MGQVEVSKSLKEESAASDMQYVSVKRNESGRKCTLNVSRQTLMRELEEKAEVAQELLTSTAEPHHTKRTFPLERRLSTITEESRSYSDSICSNSVRSNTSCRRQLPTASGTDKLIARRDVEEVREYLRHLFHLRYQHVPLNHRDEYCSRTIVNRVKPLATYLRWQTTREKGAALGLARALGLHLVELDALLRPRLENVLLLLNVDAEYVKARLMDSEHVWHWVYEHNPLAHNAQWPKLARQFLTDREQFHRIFPEEIIYANPELGIEKSNLKAMVRVGMIQLQGHYFAKIDSPDQYKLSKNAKRIDRRHHKEEEMLRRGMKESESIRKELIRQERNERYSPKRDTVSMEKLAAARGYSPECPAFEPSTHNRLKRLVSRARDAMVIRQQSRIRW